MNDAVREEDWPESIVFRFKSKREKAAFLGGLSNGFGENSCSMDWPWKSGVGFHEATAFGVRPFYTRYGQGDIVRLLARCDVAVTDGDVERWGYAEREDACEWAEYSGNKRKLPSFLKPFLLKK